MSRFDYESAELDILEAEAGSSLGRVTLREGKFHQVKRMFAATGHEVIQLRRVRFGPLTLPENLEEGTWRELSAEELERLRTAAGMKSGPAAGGTRLLPDGA